MLPAIVLGGAAAVAVGVGAGLLVASGGKRSDAERMRDDLVTKYGSKPCSDVSAIDQCNATVATLRARVDLGNAGVGVMVGAGVLAASAVTYWLVARRAAAPPQVGLVPVVGRDGGGIFLHGS